MLGNTFSNSLDCDCRKVQSKALPNETDWTVHMAQDALIDSVLDKSVYIASYPMLQWVKCKHTFSLESLTALYLVDGYR